jgi:hypothetical protein
VLVLIAIVIISHYAQASANTPGGRIEHGFTYAGGYLWLFVSLSSLYKSTLICMQYMCRVVNQPIIRIMVPMIYGAGILQMHIG